MNRMTPDRATMPGAKVGAYVTVPLSTSHNRSRNGVASQVWEIGRAHV